MRDRVEVPISQKYNLTLEEAAEYFNIGTNRLREITDENKTSMVIMVGTKRLIKRKKMEEYLDKITVL
ncbi:MAG: excisionase [Lachnospiraceae bacterium]|nr:excisionase [Lachnospiraceae bacterium]